MNNRIWIVVGTLAGAAGGAAGGYLFAKKKFTLQYEELMQQEIAEAKAHYAALYKSGPEFQTPGAVLQQRKPTLESAMAEVKEFQDIIEANRYGPKGIKVENPETKIPEKTLANQTLSTTVVTQNIFHNPNEVETPEHWEEEVALRNQDYPYVISFEEFGEGRDGYAQVTLAYYEADDVLAEPNDQPVDNVEYLIGEGSLDRFGYVSRDPNVVHVRNERINIDYEIVRSRGSYAEEVAGFTDEPEQATRPKKRASKTPRG